MLVGYMRVSTDGNRQVLDLQRDALLSAGIDERHLFEDRVSGSRGDRAGLTKALAFVRPGDCLVVWKLDRLGRSLAHLLAMLDALRTMGVAFVSLRDSGIDTTTPAGRLMLQMVGAFAEFERALIQERVRAGVARAQTAGKHCGRPRRELNLRAARLLLDTGKSEREVADLLGLPRATLQRRLRDGGPKVGLGEPG